MKKKSRALIKRKKRAVAVHRKRSLTSDIPKQDTLALVATKTLGVKIISHKDYFRPVMTNAQIYWVTFTDKKGNTTESPFVPYNPILDNIHRRGVKSIIPEHMPVQTCKEAGCYMASPGDVFHRCRVTITLRNGQVFVAEGDACKHNTTKISMKALRRVAETRAKARAGRDAVNIAVPCIVEILPYEGKMRQGDRILSEEEAGKVVMGEVITEDDKKTSATVPKGSPVMGTPTAKRIENKDENTDGEHDRRVKANARFHGEAHRLGLDTKLLHAYVHFREKVTSIKDVSVEKLEDYAENLKGAAVGSSGHKTIVAELDKMKEAA